MGRCLFGEDEDGGVGQVGVVLDGDQEVGVVPVDEDRDGDGGDGDDEEDEDHDGDDDDDDHVHHHLSTILLRALFLPHHHHDPHVMQSRLPQVLARVYRF